MIPRSSSRVTGGSGIRTRSKQPRTGFINHHSGSLLIAVGRVRRAHWRGRVGGSSVLHLGRELGAISPACELLLKSRGTHMGGSGAQLGGHRSFAVGGS